MASELVKSNLEKDADGGSGGRQRNQSLRRTTSYTPPSLQQSASTPITPTHHRESLSSASSFIDGSITPRRIAMQNGPSEISYRPRSRDGSQIQVPRRTSAEYHGGTTSKSRLPRTSLLRTSRSSMAAPMVRDGDGRDASSGREGVRAGRDERDSGRGESGIRIRERSIASSGNGNAGTAPVLNSKRRQRAPSGDIKWS
jgi:hypothetical protein